MMSQIEFRGKRCKILKMAKNENNETALKVLCNFNTKMRNALQKFKLNISNAECQTSSRKSQKLPYGAPTQRCSTMRENGG